MAGHSKWANIRHRKERVDAKRGKVFSRLVKEVFVAAKMGGIDPDANPRLRLALERARDANVPNDNIDRAVKRGGGQLEGVNYAEVRYEGYAAGGAALLLDCLTDNKNRTLPEVRRALIKHGGNLAAEGAVSYLFSRCGQLLFSNPSDGAKLMDVAAEHNAAEFNEEDGGVEILCAPEDFPALLDAVRAGGFPPDAADIVMRADGDMPLFGEEARRMQKLLDALEELDDVQSVYTNADIQEETS